MKSFILLCISVTCFSSSLPLDAHGNSTPTVPLASHDEQPDLMQDGNQNSSSNTSTTPPWLLSRLLSTPVIDQRTAVLAFRGPGAKPTAVADPMFKYQWRCDNPQLCYIPGQQMLLSALSNPDFRAIANGIKPPEPATPLAPVPAPVAPSSPPKGGGLNLASALPMIGDWSTFPTQAMFSGLKLMLPFMEMNPFFMPVDQLGSKDESHRVNELTGELRQKPWETNDALSVPPPSGSQDVYSFENIDTVGPNGALINAAMQKAQLQALSRSMPMLTQNIETQLMTTAKQTPSVKKASVESTWTESKQPTMYADALSIKPKSKTNADAAFAKLQESSFQPTWNPPLGPKASANLLTTNWRSDTLWKANIGLVDGGNTLPTDWRSTSFEAGVGRTDASPLIPAQAASAPDKIRYNVLYNPLSLVTSLMHKF